MKVGDLVRVYDFSRVARERLVVKKPQWSSQKVNAHYIGLVVATNDNDPKYRRVVRGGELDWEDCNMNRLEVIA